MKNYGNIISNILIALSLTGLIHGLISLYSRAHIELDPWALVLVAGVAVAAGVTTTLMFRFKFKLNVAITLITVTVSFYAGNFILGLTERNLFNIFETKVVRPMVPNEATKLKMSGDGISARPADSRTVGAVSKALKKDGIDPSFMYSAVTYLPLIQNERLPKFLPLSSLSNAVTVMCNEGDQREFPVGETDRFGFNNDDRVYAWPGDKILIVGDSFAWGSCVHQEQSVAGVLRRNGYRTISAGIPAFGPLLTLASLKEYGEALKPKTVLWFYFDGNDITDLAEKGLRSRFLLRYLEDGFTQNLINRQAEVDAFWRQSEERGKIVQQFENSDGEKARWRGALASNLGLVRELTGLHDLRSLTDDQSLIRIFSKILSIANRRVEAWGGRLYFVIIPNKDDYHGRVPKFRFPVMSRIKDIGIPIIDVDDAIRRTGDPLKFYPVRNQWGHFNPAGYRLFAGQIIAAIESDLRDAIGSNSISNPGNRTAAAPRQNAEAPAKFTRIDYNSYGQTSSVIPIDAASARNTHGASILGYTFTPNNVSGAVRIKIGANAYSQTDNELVAAVFLSGREEPVHLIRKRLNAGERGFLDSQFRLPFATRSQLTFDLRVGPARPGAIYINGDAKSKRDVRNIPYFSISEITE